MVVAQGHAANKARRKFTIFLCPGIKLHQKPDRCMCTVAAADGTEAAYRGIAEGLLLQALGPLVAAASTAVGASLKRLLDARGLGIPDVPSGSQSFPDNTHIAPPIHSPVEKDRVRLQVRCGGLSPTHPQAACLGCF